MHNIYIYILVMAGVTYLIRMLPLALSRKEITSPFIKSFLYYVPYACLAAMTFPAILFATDSIISAAVGFVVALIAAYKEKSLLTVALFACAAVLLWREYWNLQCNRVCLNYDLSIYSRKLRSISPSKTVAAGPVM